MNQEANELYQAGKVKDAVHLLVNLIDAHPHDIDNYLQLATILVDQGSADQEVELLERAKNNVSNPTALNYDLAIGYYMQGNFNKALALLDSMPNNDLTLYQKALVFLKLGQPQKALALAISIKKLDKRVNELIGGCWLALGDLKHAHASYLQIPEAERSAKVNFLLGITIFDQDREQSDHYFAKAKKQDPKYYAYATKQYQGILDLLRKKKNN